MCASLWVCVHECTVYKRVLGPLELELQVVVSHLVRMLGTKFKPSARVVHVLNCWALSPASRIYLLKVSFFQYCHLGDQVSNVNLCEVTIKPYPSHIILYTNLFQKVMRDLRPRESMYGFMWLHANMFMGACVYTCVGGRIVILWHVAWELMHQYDLELAAFIKAPGKASWPGKRT